MHIHQLMIALDFPSITILVALAAASRVFPPVLTHRR